MILIERRESKYGTIDIQQVVKDGSFVYLQGIGVQSRADHTGEAMLDYAQMTCATVIAAGAKSALVIGCAGGTIATTLVRRQMKVVAVDTNPDAFDLAKRYFKLPPSVETHVADGRRYLEAIPAKWDAIILDAYDGIRAPRHLKTVEFFQLVASRLAPRGLVISNVVTERLKDTQPDQIASAMQAAGIAPRMLDESDEFGGNCLVIGGNATFDMRRLSTETQGLRTAHRKFRSRRMITCTPIYETYRTLKAHSGTPLRAVPARA